MSYFSFEEYKFKNFVKSNTANKKYDAILINRKTKKEKRIPFGDSRYEHYKDKTGLGLFTSKNHLDKKRRDLYKMRHQKDIKDGYYSAGYFSMHYLW